MTFQGLVGMPVMFPLVVFIDKPWGRKFAAEAVRIMVCIKQKGDTELPWLKLRLYLTRRKLWQGASA